MDAFIRYLSLQGLSKNTMEAYAGHVRRFHEWCVASFGTQPDRLHRANVLDFRTYLQHVAKRSPQTINAYLSALSRLNAFYIEEGRQTELAVLRSDAIRIQESMANPWDGEEREVEAFRQRVLEDASPTRCRDYAIITLLAYAGLRISEALSLREGDISLASRELMVTGKGGKRRTVLLGDKVLHALGAYRRQRGAEPNDDAYLFTSRLGRPLCRSRVNQIFNQFSDTLTPHALRHFYCSQAQNKAGMSAMETAQQVGHKSLRTTMRYTHASKKDLMEKINRL